MSYSGSTAGSTLANPPMLVSSEIGSKLPVLEMKLPPGDFLQKIKLSGCLFYKPMPMLIIFPV